MNPKAYPLADARLTGKILGLGPNSEHGLSISTYLYLHLYFGNPSISRMVHPDSEPKMKSGFGWKVSRKVELETGFSAKGWALSLRGGAYFSQ